MPRCGTEAVCQLQVRQDLIHFNFWVRPARTHLFQTAKKLSLGESIDSVSIAAVDLRRP